MLQKRHEFVMGRPRRGIASDAQHFGRPITGDRAPTERRERKEELGIGRSGKVGSRRPDHHEVAPLKRHEFVSIGRLIKPTICNKQTIYAYCRNNI